MVQDSLQKRLEDAAESSRNLEKLRTTSNRHEKEQIRLEKEQQRLQKKKERELAKARRFTKAQCCLFQRLTQLEHTGAEGS